MIGSEKNTRLMTIWQHKVAVEKHPSRALLHAIAINDAIIDTHYCVVIYESLVIINIDD
jgi:hypothetical protein